MMPAAYKLSQFPGLVIRVADGANIPDSLENEDHLAYLQWVGEGNEADPADPLPKPEPTRAERVDALVETGLTALTGATTVAQVKAVFAEVLTQLGQLDGTP